MRKRNRRAIEVAYDKLCSIRFLASPPGNGSSLELMGHILKRAEEGLDAMEGSSVDLANECSGRLPLALARRLRRLGG